MSFRKLLRVVAGVACLYPIATCTDFTGPSGRGVRVPIVPTFSAGANFAKALYAAAGIEFDRVRIVIIRDEAEVLKDTTVAFSPTSAELTLPLLITANPGEVVTVTLEYRTADIVLYSGTQSVTTVAMGATPTTPPTPLILVPVGPGATATTVEISPASGTFPISASVPLSATAFTADHSAIANAIFAWSVDDATVASVNAQGIVQPTSKGGVAKVRATTLNAKFAEATITFSTGPASLVIQSGGNQSALALDALPAPVVVKVLDANGVVVSGATVNFAVVAGGGSVAVVNGVSDASGLVSANWTLGAAVGTQAITATAVALPNAPITINATATERPAKMLVFGQQPLRSLMNASITPPVTVKALDDKGHEVAGYTGAITMSFDANPTGATLGGTLTVNALTGVATFPNLTVNKAGEGYRIKAVATGLTTAVSDAFVVDQVPSGLSLNAGGNQTAAIKSTLSQIAVKVADANGIGVAGVTVTFAVASGGGSIVVDNGVTDANGIARATWTLGSTVGAQSITATSGTLTGSPLTISATATALPAVALAFVQQPSTVVVNGTISPAVSVKAVDAEGNTVTGFTGSIGLTLSTNPGSATLGGTTAVTAVGGVATFSNLSLNAVGAGYKITAASGSLTAAVSSAFNVVTPPPTALEFAVQPSNVQAGVAITPAIQVKVVDANGVIVTGASTTVSLSVDTPASGVTISGGGPVAVVNGVAVFSNVKLSTATVGVKLKATATGLTSAVSGAFTVTPAGLVWVGSISTDWHNANNWSPAAVPTAADSVTIGGATNQPIIGANATARIIVIQAAGSLTVNGTGVLLVTTPTIVNSGTLRLTTASILGDIDNRGLLLVDGIGGATNVKSTPSATTRIASTGGGVLSVAQVFLNDGLIELTDAGAGAAAQLATGDSLVNRAGGTIAVKQASGTTRLIQGVIRNHGAINVESSYGLAVIQAAGSSMNTGTITFTNGGQFLQVFSDPAATFDNTGTIALGSANWTTQSGSVRVRAPGTITGTGKLTATSANLDIDLSRISLRFSVDELTRFDKDSLVIPTGLTPIFENSVIGQKTVVFGTLKTSAVDFAAELSIKNGGTVEMTTDALLQANLTIVSGGILRLIALDRDMTVHSDDGFSNGGLIELTSSGGPFATEIEADGPIVNALGGTMSVLGGTGGERRIDASSFDNKGTVNIAADAWLRMPRGSASIANSGTINLLDASDPGRILAEQNTLSFAVKPDVSGGSVLTNTGSINVGTFRTLYIENSSTFLNGGVVGGNGTVAVGPEATFTNSGMFAPGGLGKIGTLNFTGNFDVGSGSVEIDVADMVKGVFDLLQVSATASVNGKINVNKLSGFVPGGTLLVITGLQCLGQPTISPSGVNGWDGYNDGCFHIFYTPGSPFPQLNQR